MDFHGIMQWVRLDETFGDPPNAVQEASGLFCHKGTFLVHGQPKDYQGSQGFSFKTTFKSSWSKSFPVPGIILL